MGINSLTIRQIEDATSLANFHCGIQKTTKTYEESEELSGYVMDLQAFDKLLLEAQKDGSITIEKNVITGIEGKVFQL